MILELFNKVYNYKVSYHLKNDVSYKFVTDDGRIFYVIFDTFDYKFGYKALTIDFGEKKGSKLIMNITNDGNAFSILSTVINIVMKYFNKERDIDIIFISAYDYEPTKVSLYGKLIDRFSTLGYKVVDKFRDSGYYVFCLANKDIDKIKKIIKGVYKNDTEISDR